MLIGVTLMRLAADPQYSPQFSRGGNSATFSCDVLGIAGGAGTNLQVDVEHKNQDDTAWLPLISLPPQAALGITSINASAIMEQLRFRYVVGGAAATNAVHFNMLAPQWRPY